MTPDYYRRESCRMCDATALRPILQLTPTPPGNHFLTQSELGRPEPRYPLELEFCAACHHVQLAHVVDPRVLYRNNYSYVSGTSAHFVRHLERYATAMVQRFELGHDSLVADIGSNDGTCLRFFKGLGMRVVGVDPATEIASRATAAGIETVPEFFSEDLATKLRARLGPAALITSHNACAHIDDLAGVVRGVRHWLANDGVFVLEVGYLADVYEKLYFDTIYHEHLDYHTVAPFESLFARTGMELLAVERIEPQGGSIRVMAQKASGPRKRDSSGEALIRMERTMRLDQTETFTNFGEKIAALGARLRLLLASIKDDGRSIAAYGAPTKATTLLSHFGIGRETLDFISEDNPLKQGLYSPYSHIPVLPSSEMYARRPDYMLILAWNFAAPIMAMHDDYIRQGGRFIVPLPEPYVV